MKTWIPNLIATTGLALASSAQAPATAQAPASARAAATVQAPAVEWNARNAEHLLNRAGFGARPAEIQRAVALGHQALVDQLLIGWDQVEPFHLDAKPKLPPRPELARMTPQERQQMRNSMQREEREVMVNFATWWVREMLQGSHPLRERMTLFWHGHFTTSYNEVKDSVALVEQNELLREHALGSFRALVHGIVRDSAMLQYLDNDKNVKGSPNENLARELMELFTLGAGNYSEQDVQEAARALTGWRSRRDLEEPVFMPRLHDDGEKTILGKTGKMGADELVELLLEQPACPRWIAGKLLAYFEGRAPTEERLQAYADYLKQSDYQIAPFLRRLFLDPEFYGPKVVGRRISGPVEHLVAISRRLGIDPPPVALWHAAGQNGQRLFMPPNVKGWEGGQTWITTSTLLQRGNFAGMLLGVVKYEDVMAAEALPEEPAEPAMEPSMGAEGEMQPRPEATPRRAAEGGIIGRLLGREYVPQINLTARCKRAGAADDESIVSALADELLAVELSAESRGVLVEFLRNGRMELRLEEGKLLDEREAEKLLRRLAHLILSLPEAQLC